MCLCVFGGGGESGSYCVGTCVVSLIDMTCLSILWGICDCRLLLAFCWVLSSSLNQLPESPLLP